MNNIIIPIITAILTVILGWITIFIKDRILQKTKNESKKIKMQREAFEKLLDLHSERIQGKHLKDEWIDEFAKMSHLIIVWGSDKVLYEYIKFRQNQFSDKENIIKDYELYFGKAVLEFRKELGYKNKKNYLQPEHIVLIFKSGWNNPL
ncbi:MAG TPA: hypothetical protein PLP19_19245 [bacterium]|nr:hypothetical protein [bacterium]HPN45632.1 hypothetical protein [bacterium]